MVDAWEPAAAEVERTPLLERLASDDRAALLEAGRPRSVRAGATLFHEGDDAHDVLLLVRGIVKIWITAASGRNVILDVLDDGAILGELGAIDGAARSASASALVDCELLAVPVDRFRALLEQRPSVSLEMLRLLAERLRGASRRQLEFSASDALGRLCGAIVDLAERYGTVREGVREVTLPLGQSDLGALGGLSREAIVKGLKALRQLGWVEGEGRSLRLVDESALRDRSRE